MAFPKNEQASLVDRAGLGIGRSGYKTSPTGIEFSQARYEVAQQPTPQPTTANHAFPYLWADSDARSWMELISKSGSTDISKSRFDYPNYDGSGSSELWSDLPTKLAVQFEVQFDHGSGGVAGNANLVQFDDAAGEQVVLRSNSSEQFVLRYYNTSGGDTNMLFNAPQRSIGNATTYTFWLFIDTDNDTIDLWHAEGSITDVDIINATALTVTKNPWTGDSQITNCGLGAIVSFGFFSGCTSNATADLKLRARCVHTQHEAFSTEPDGTFSMFDLHRKLTEKSTIYWDDSAEKYVLASTCNVPVGMFPCGTTCNASLVVYPSLADYTNDTSAVATITPASVASLHNYRRLTQRTTGVLNPETTYVYAWKLTLQDASYNGGSSYTVRGLPCYVHTPPAKGEPFTVPPHIDIASCKHQDYVSRSASSVRAETGWADDRCRILIELGDAVGGYMDEVRFLGKVGDWDGDGLSPVTAETATGSGGLGRTAEGAETRQHMADECARIAHSDHELESARYWVRFVVGDDHDRSVNDMAMMDMLQENRDDDGTNQITPWRKRGKSGTHPRYTGESGGPLDGLEHCAIEWFDDITGTSEYAEYDDTPREVAETLLGHWQEWGIATEPTVASGLRMDASGVNKYGTTKFDAGDSGYYNTYLGDVMLLALDTRLTMTMWPSAPWGDGGPSFFSWAEQWIEDTIAACEVSGLIVAIPGYVEGYSRGSLKAYDNIGWFMSTTSADPVVAPIKAGAIKIFKTAIDANPRIKWVAFVVGDHHFASLDSSVTSSFSSKCIMQLADGGGHAIVQEPEDLGQESDPDYDIDEGALGEDYIWLTNFGLESGGIRTHTRFVLEDAATGAGTCHLWNCAGGTASLVASHAISGIPLTSAGRRTRSRDRRGR